MELARFPRAPEPSGWLEDHSPNRRVHPAHRGSGWLGDFPLLSTPVLLFPRESSPQRSEPISIPIPYHERSNMIPVIFLPVVVLIFITTCWISKQGKYHTEATGLLIR